ncbi:B-(1-6) glucan synthase [Ephemerocybe angulata]|uniref:glucan endo-1,3-beta-D-glucosidase n=1 Tax=Ephemerocybe angulata TaxID=980116 RepID=A0A8H6MDA4_9AGAR|nr:B-(1-6) glucan synthase [Tulosesus angulatus]
MKLSAIGVLLSAGATFLLYVASAHPLNTTSDGLSVEARAVHASAPPNCFPALGFKMPSSIPSSLNNWWCDYSTEYAFVGVSYEITACQSLDTLKREFADVRNNFKGRYVRLYGFCDNSGYYNNVIEAAWSAGIGVHALIWFGFDGSTIYKSRRDALFSVLKSNAKAKFVTRTVQFGSEPLYDWAIGAQDLANEVKSAKSSLSSLGIPITVSEMAYGYQVRQNDGSIDVLKAIDFVDAHMLPFFSQQASTAKNSWPIVMTDLNWFLNNAGGKKIYLSQNGWPSVTSSGVQPNSPNAVANVQNEQDYYDLLDSHCSDFKSMKGGGVGWFAHIYSDNQEPGYGIYGTNGQLKIRFSPKTSC